MGIPRPRDVFRVHEDERYKPIHDRPWTQVVAEVAAASLPVERAHCASTFPLADG